MTDDIAGELKHALMDLELKDAYALEMRSLAREREEEAHEARMLAQALQRSVDDLQAQLLEARALLASRTGQLAEVSAEAERVRTELTAVTNRASYLLIASATKALGRFGPATALARRCARRLARRPTAGA